MQYMLTCALYYYEYMSGSWLVGTAQMQRGIQETTDAMHSNMSSILNRGGKIEHLVKQSDNLITPSKMFKREIQGACSDES